MDLDAGMVAEMDAFRCQNGTEMGALGAEVGAVMGGLRLTKGATR